MTDPTSTTSDPSRPAVAIDRNRSIHQLSRTLPLRRFSTRQESATPTTNSAPPPTAACRTSPRSAHSSSTRPHHHPRPRQPAMDHRHRRHALCTPGPAEPRHHHGHHRCRRRPATSSMRSLTRSTPTDGACRRLRLKRPENTLVDLPVDDAEATRLRIDGNEIVVGSERFPLIETGGNYPLITDHLNVGSDLNAVDVTVNGTTTRWILGRFEQAGNPIGLPDGRSWSPRDSPARPSSAVRARASPRRHLNRVLYPPAYNYADNATWTATHQGIVVITRDESTWQILRYPFPT